MYITVLNVQSYHVPNLNKFKLLFYVLLITASFLTVFGSTPALGQALPDLIVTSLQAPDSLDRIGFEVSWTVDNQGDAATDMKYYDALYFSEDDQLDASDILLPLEGDGVDSYAGNSYYTRNDPLKSAENYTATVHTILPSTRPGQYYLIAVTNAVNTWWGMPQESESNNNRLSRPLELLELAYEVKSTGPAPELEWAKSFRIDDDPWARGEYALEAPDGCFILLGGSEQGTGRLYMIKTDPDGNTQWQRTISSDDYPSDCQSVFYRAGSGRCLQSCSDGGYVIVGTKIYGCSLGNRQEAFMLRIDEKGDREWEKTYSQSDGQVDAHSVILTPDGGFLIAGNAGNQALAWLVKTDDHGELLWQERYDADPGGPYHQGTGAVSLTNTEDGGLILCGYSDYYYYGPWSFLWLQKIEAGSPGPTSWFQTFKPENETRYTNNHGFSIYPTPDGGYLCAAQAWIPFSGSAIYLVKTNASGAKLWEKTYTKGTTQGYDMEPAQDGGHLLAASFTAGAAGSRDCDIWLKKLAPDGGEGWEMIISGPQTAEWARSIQETTDGGYLVAGQRGVAGSYEMWLLKLRGYKHVFRLTEISNQMSEPQETCHTLEIAIPLSVDGDLTGEMDLLLNSLEITSGSFQGQALFRGTWEATLQGADYQGECMGSFFPTVRGRYTLKGTLSGDLCGLLEGVLIPENEGSTKVLNATCALTRLGIEPVDAQLSLQGTIAENQMGPDSQMVIRQSSVYMQGEGRSPDGQVEAISSMVTQVVVIEPDNLWQGYGICHLSYTLPLGSGEIWGVISPSDTGQTDREILQGLSTSPLRGLVSGQTFLGPPRTLLLMVETAAPGEGPKPNLVAYPVGPRSISPGQTVDYLVEYRNDGMVPAEDVVVVLQIPPYTYPVATSKGGVYWQERSQVFWTVESLDPREGGSFYARVQYPGGLNEETINHVIALIGSETPSAVDSKLPVLPIDYLLYKPTEVVSTRSLTNEEVEIILSNERAADLYQLAVESGFEPLDIGVRAEVSDGSHLDRLMLVKDNGYLAFLDSLEGTCFLEKFEGDNVTFCDRDGGLVYEKSNGSITSYGKWSEPRSRAVSLPGVEDTESCSNGQCAGNCFLTNLASDFDFTGLSNVQSCEDCVRNHGANWDACLACASAVAEVSGPYSHIPGLISTARCISDCLDNPNSHCCQKLESTMKKCQGCGPFIPSRVGCSGLYECIWPGVWSEKQNPPCDCPGFPWDPNSDAKLVKQCIYCEACVNGECFCDDCRPGMIKSVTTVAHDPNIKYGPEGSIQAGQVLEYRVEYENEGNGTAYGVYFTDTLDLDLDDSTLEIGPVKDVETGEVIGEEGIYDPLTRTITWIAGEVGSRRGGYADFSVRVIEGAPYGTEVINFATIYFPSVPETTTTNAVVSVVNRPPSSPNTPEGPTEGEAGKTYSYRTSAVDPDLDPLKYVFHWGDGTSSQTDPLGSGINGTAYHHWTSEGNYEVTVEAVDVYGHASSPSLPLTVALGPLNQPPEIIEFSASPADQQIAGGDVVLSVSASDNDNQQLFYRFLIDGKVKVDWSESPTWTWTTSDQEMGTHTLEVSVKDGSHNQEGDDSATLPYTVLAPNLPPEVPSAPTGPDEAVANVLYRFAAVVHDPDGDQVKAVFDWGDGTTSTTDLVDSGTSTSASHTWSTAGTYQVKAMATDSKGATSGYSSSLTVTISPNKSPNAPGKPSGSAKCVAGSSYSYSTSASDPDKDNVKYTFDWGDGTKSETGLVKSGIKSSATHAWSSAGTYLVKANATDSKGATSGYSSSLTITVNPNKPPTAPGKPSGSATCVAGSSYSYSTSASDPDKDKVKYTFDWGDGTKSDTVLVNSGIKSSTTHAWSTPGTYLVKANATDFKGAASGYSSSLTITVNPNKPPTAPSKPSGAISGYAWAVYSYSISAKDPDGDTLKYTFDWGDGTKSDTVLVNSGIKSSTTHAWSTPGTYLVKANATDFKGDVSGYSGSLSVTISPNSIPGTPSVPTGTVTGKIKKSYSYTTSVTDPDGDKLKYTFDWGDGKTSVTSFVNSGTSASSSHAWSKAGTFQVKVMTTDSKGAPSISWSSQLAVTIT